MFFISCRKCQNTLQSNTCAKYCTKDQSYRFQCIHIYVGDVGDGVLEDPGYVEEVGDALLHAAWSLQNTHR